MSDVLQSEVDELMINAATACERSVAEARALDMAWLIDRRNPDGHKFDDLLNEMYERDHSALQGLINAGSGSS